jgi:uncharacterized Zn-binding protein involved in type VI secretion
MAQPAIRNTDVHICPQHGAETIGAVAEMDIAINKQPALRVGHCFTCAGQPAQVATGAATVLFHGEFAARAFDDSSHKGKLVIGSGNVVIGGPTGMGCVGAGTKTCKAMAGGRKSGDIHQSYGNCMPESLRQIIRRATGRPVTEDEVLNYGLANNLSTKAPGTGQHGGTSPQDAVILLKGFGVAAENVPSAGAPTLDDIKHAIAGGKGVVTTLHTKDYWPGGRGGYHAVLVSAVELDGNGNVVGVFINDTGLGECGMWVPAMSFAASIKSGGGQPLVVTKERIW